MRSTRWTDRTRALVQVALLGCCCLIFVAVRALVDVDNLSDPIELALNAAALVALVASALLSFLVMRATQVPVLRAGVTLMSLLVASLTFAFVRLAYADVSVELADLVAPVQPAEARTQIVIGPTGDDVRLSGDITEGAADRLARLLATHPAVTRIHLTSDGGLADEGQALAEVIAAHRLTTYVPDYCVSACTLAFVGGHERVLMDGARLGFHTPYREGVLGQTFVGEASDQRAAYLRAGLAADFVDEALNVAPDDIWIPERSRLLAAHVVTGYVDRYRLPDSILDGAADARGAREAVLRNFTMLKGLDAAAPRMVDRIADWYLRSYRRGASEGASTEGLERIVSATLVLVLARADDAALRDLARFMQAATGGNVPDRECVAIGAGVDLVRAAVALERSDDTADTRAEHLVDAALASGRHSDAPPAAAPVAFGPGHDDCASVRGLYEAAAKGKNLEALRRLIQAQAPSAARVLAPLVAPSG